MASPIGTPAAEASRRRASRSEEYRRLQEEFGDVQEIARQIVYFRMCAGLTQRELADLAGTSHSQISRIESGFHKPSYDTLQRIARAMGLRARVHFEEAAPAVPASKLKGEPLAEMAVTTRRS